MCWFWPWVKKQRGVVQTTLVYPDYGKYPAPDMTGLVLCDYCGLVNLEHHGLPEDCRDLYAYRRGLAEIACDRAWELNR